MKRGREMKKNILMLAIVVTFSLSLFGETRKSLFLYDMDDKEGRLYIQEIRKQFDEKNLAFDEIAVESEQVPDLSGYARVLIYGKVMAFNQMSPIRDWLTSSPVPKDQDFYLLLTANRWFLNKYTRQIEGLVVEKGGIVADAVSAATKDLTEQEKKGLVSDLFRNIP